MMMMMMMMMMMIIIIIIIIVFFLLQDEAVEAVVTALLDMVEHPEEPMKITWWTLPPQPGWQSPPRWYIYIYIVFMFFGSGSSSQWGNWVISTVAGRFIFLAFQNINFNEINQFQGKSEWLWQAIHVNKKNACGRRETFETYGGIYCGCLVGRIWCDLDAFCLTCLNCRRLSIPKSRLQMLQKYQQRQGTTRNTWKTSTENERRWNLKIIPLKSSSKLRYFRGLQR